MLPSTTLEKIEIEINENLTLIDTPGIIEEGNISNYINTDMLKKIICKKEIKPITYQIKSKQNVLIEDLVIIECENNNLTFYMSNNLKIERKFKEIEKNNLKEHIIRLKNNNDIVISGLGFIKATNDEIIKIYLKDGIDVYTRTSLI